VTVTRDESQKRQQPCPLTPSHTFSLPDHSLLQLPSSMAANLPGLSASVTRILYLSGFSKELKTRDIQVAFSKFEKSPAGLKIKWKDDTSLLIVFQDPTVGEYTIGQRICYILILLFHAF